MLMCWPIATMLPWLTGASAIASVASAMKPAPSIDIPPAPKVETPAPAPTVQDVNPTAGVTSTAGAARAQMRKQLAAQQSWVDTKATGSMGLTGVASTKKSLLGGIAQPLGA